MIRMLSLLWLAMIGVDSNGQSHNHTDSLFDLQQNLELSTAGNNDVVTEDDYYWQQWEHLKKHPYHLNNISAEQLQEFVFLSPIQIESFFRYRQTMGNLISIYELQAIPYWDVATIIKLKPFVTVTQTFSFGKTFTERFTRGEHSYMCRFGQTFEHGMFDLKQDDSSANNMLGSPQKIAFRYKYVYKNLLQYGILAEKDAGEPFFSKTYPGGFDFYSAHLMIKDFGLIKTLVLGDYTVSMGQGLIQCQGLAFKKSIDLFSAKRPTTVLRAYNSLGEHNFHRGVGITFGDQKKELVFFVSTRKLDANLVSDTVDLKNNYITSIQTSGLHRTHAERSDKSILHKLTLGATARLFFKKGQLNFNAIHHEFNIPIKKENQPYNLFSFNGTQLTNYSVDYGFTYNNCHFFGEFALSDNKKVGLINGLFVSVARNADLSFIYRNISPSFHSFNANAFLESSTPINEHGLFSGISIRPFPRVQIDAFCDVFSFRWLRYRMSTPGSGTECQLQLSYKPNRNVELNTRFRYETKAVDAYDENDPFVSIVYPVRRSIRSHFSMKLDHHFNFRSRAEYLIVQTPKKNSESGFMISAELHYKPLMMPISANARLMYFETDSYESRLYAYENDMPYAFSIPVINGKGMRYYLNLNYDFNKKISFWLKWAQTFHANMISSQSYFYSIVGKRTSELKFQIIFRH